jgi:hypothetical protein
MYAIVQVLKQHADRIVVSNPIQTRAIADAKIKTAKIDGAPRTANRPWVRDPSWQLASSAR